MWQLQSNIRDGVLFPSATTMEQRTKAASTCVRKLGIKFPALIDEISNPTEQAYTGWPDRLYVIDPEGRIAYKSEAGPFGFRPEELQKAVVDGFFNQE